MGDLKIIPIILEWGPTVLYDIRKNN